MQKAPYAPFIASLTCSLSSMLHCTTSAPKSAKARDALESASLVTARTAKALPGSCLRLQHLLDTTLGLQAFTNHGAVKTSKSAGQDSTYQGTTLCTSCTKHRDDLQVPYLHRTPTTLVPSTEVCRTSPSVAKSGSAQLSFKWQELPNETTPKAAPGHRLNPFRTDGTDGTQIRCLYKSRERRAGMGLF